MGLLTKRNIIQVIGCLIALLLYFGAGMYLDTFRSSNPPLPPPPLQVRYNVIELPLSGFSGMALSNRGEVVGVPDSVASPPACGATGCCVPSHL